ncbi:putative secreted protein (Por secretion system target) [Dyadobacter jejuensis]|uniref:Putative secreted protein (Por secretion system target) n=1 Tax=Dyadobacter jejuensis TaxID=1082580 RepID=A0A316ADV5_9BACT|nr:T9SS type A sorting domain-containing protein [Dyadobacter jejuensis]PWJ55955.1 putative secreted protein (Por secretion system target) [Dyadobacter jejuensis]
MYRLYLIFFTPLLALLGKRKPFLPTIGLGVMLIGAHVSMAQNYPGGVPLASWYSADGTSTLHSDAGGSAVSDQATVYRWKSNTGDGFDLLQTSSGNRPVYSNATELANFNPTVSFDGVNDWMQFSAGTGVNMIDRATGTLMAAGKVNLLKRSGFVGFHSTMDYPGLHLFSNSKLLFFTGGPGYQGVSSNLFAANTFFTAGTGWVNGGGSSASYASATVSLNGTRVNYNGSQLNNANLSTGARDFRIGADSNYGSFSGQLNEVLVFEDALTVDQLDRVETYLALKYGTTYADGTRDYKNSAGEVVWNAAANAGWRYNVAGIARDDHGALLQKQSWSTNAGAQVLVSTTGLANSNAANGTSLGANQYLIWGDNGQPKSATVAIAGIANISHRFAATWKVTNKNGVGTVRVAWPKALSNLSLIQSADDVFDASDVVTSMSSNETTINGIVYNYADVSFTDGQFFTFAAKLVAPGGVTADLRVWLRSDEGFAPDQWKDLSGNVNNYTQTNASRQPFVASSSYNFNPVIDFGTTGTDARFMAVPAGKPYAANGTNSTIFTASLNKSSGGYSDIVGFGATTTTSSLIQANYPTLTKLGDRIVIYPYTGNPGYPSIEINKLYLNDVSFTVGTSGIKYGENGVTKTVNQTVSAGNIRHADGSILGAQSEPRNGYIGEFIAYERDLTEAEKQRIRTYVAIKYGFSLPHDYIASDGVTTLWSQSTNTGYNNNIAGIARDDEGSLYQKQSRSTDQASNVLIGLGSLANSNAENSGTLSNGQAVLWGDNGLSKTLATSFNFSSVPDLNLRFGAIWKVQNTGGVGTVRIAWPSGTPRLTLIQSTDEVIDDTDMRTDMTANTVTIAGETYNYADVTLNDGQYFTFAGYVLGPGGVASAAWYRADAAGQQFTDAGNTLANDNETIYQWNEYKGTGYNLLQNTSSARPVFSNLSTQVNFNPTVTFDGSNDEMSFSPASGVDVIDRASGSLYAAGYYNSNKNSGFLGFHATMDYPGLHMFNTSGTQRKLLFFTGGPGYQGLADDVVSSKSYFTAGSGWENGAGATTSYAAATVSFNGIRKSYSGSELLNANLTTSARDLLIGGDSNYGKFSGQLNEIVVFENKLSTDEMDRVETYLALKYGSTYAAGTRDYKNANSNTVWASGTNNGYHFHIAGIARDDQGSLYQKQSWSTDAGKQVLISTTGLANTNASNTGVLSDGQFLIWGDNGLAKVPTVTISGIANVNHRFASIWKVQNTSGVGQVRVAWPKGYAHLKLIQSADDVINSSDVITDMAGVQVINGVEYAYSDVTLTDGQYFTFAAYVQAPGGVTNGLTHWYRADIFAEAAGDGADVKTWTDFTSGVVSSQFESVELPKLKLGGAEYFNFNPGINFTSASQKIGNITEQTLYSLDFDMFSLTKEGMSSGRFFNVGMDNTTLNGNNWDHPGLYGNGNIARRNNTGGDARISNPGSVNFAGNSPSVMYYTFSDLSMSKGLNGADLGSAYSHPSRGAATGGHIFGANSGAVTSGDDSGFIGHIGEMIVYGAGTITPDERKKVDTYLAIKYGVTLHSSANYTTSKNQVVWDATANATYYNNVAGLGRDEISALHQKQSRSQIANSNNQVTIGLGEIASTNAENLNNLSEDEYLLWGDNGNTQAMTNSGSTYTAFEYAGSVDNARRMNRVWKVQNTNVGQPVIIRFPVASVGTTTLLNDACADFAIIYASDAAFTTNVVAMPLTVNETNYEAVHTFPNGYSYFTFGRVTPLSPGTAYLPTTQEVTSEYGTCGVGEWTFYHRTGVQDQNLLGVSGFSTTEKDNFEVTITPEGVEYENGSTITKLMPRITTVTDGNSSPLSTGKVRVYYDSAEMAAAVVSGYVSDGWFKYEGDADEVLADVYADGVLDPTKAVEVTPAASGMEDGVAYVEFHNISAFSSFIYLSTTEASPLPVTLTQFNVSRDEQSALLNWSTANEENSNVFVIERSADAKNWNEIGQVNASELSLKELKYSFSDASPYAGINYYRLKMVDLDGSFAYSSIRSLRMDAVASVVLYPNPVSNRLMFQDLNPNTIDRVLVYDHSGVRRMSVDSVSSAGIDVTGLSSDVYVIVLKMKDGSVSRHKIVVRK